MVGAGKTLFGYELARQRAKAPLHAVADDGAADLLGNCEADAHRWVRILAVADEQDETGHRRAQAAVRGDEVRALLDGN